MYFGDILKLCRWSTVLKLQPLDRQAVLSPDAIGRLSQLEHRHS
jgi:hypothetical protein